MSQNTMDLPGNRIRNFYKLVMEENHAKHDAILQSIVDQVLSPESMDKFVEERINKIKEFPLTHIDCTLKFPLDLLFETATISESLFCIQGKQSPYTISFKYDYMENNSSDNSSRRMLSDYYTKECPVTKKAYERVKALFPGWTVDTPYLSCYEKESKYPRIMMTLHVNLVENGSCGQDKKYLNGYYA